MHNVIIRSGSERDYYEIFCPNHHNLIYGFDACAAADLCRTWELNAREFYGGKYTFGGYYARWVQYIASHTLTCSH